MMIPKKGQEIAGSVRKATGSAGYRPSRGGLRKKDTGERGNGGQFGTLTRAEPDVAVHSPDPVDAMQAQGRSGQFIASLCTDIDAERDGYAGALDVDTDDGAREYYLRPDGPDRIHAEYLCNRSDNYGTVNQASFDLAAGEATFYYDFEDEGAVYSSDEWVPVDASFDPDGGPEEISHLMQEMVVDDGGAEDGLRESMEDPDEAARDAYLRGIGVRRGGPRFHRPLVR